jgi:hypothetical protein
MHEKKLLSWDTIKNQFTLNCMDNKHTGFE